MMERNLVFLDDGLWVLFSIVSQKFIMNKWGVQIFILFINVFSSIAKTQNPLISMALQGDNSCRAKTFQFKLQKVTISPTSFKTDFNRCQFFKRNLWIRNDLNVKVIQSVRKPKVWKSKSWLNFSGSNFLHCFLTLNNFCTFVLLNPEQIYIFVQKQKNWWIKTFIGFIKKVM